MQVFALLSHDVLKFAGGGLDKRLRRFPNFLGLNPLSPLKISFPTPTFIPQALNSQSLSYPLKKRVSYMPLQVAAFTGTVILGLAFYLHYSKHLQSIPTQDTVSSNREKLSSQTLQDDLKEKIRRNSLRQSTVHLVENIETTHKLPPSNQSQYESGSVEKLQKAKSSKAVTALPLRLNSLKAMKKWHEDETEIYNLADFFRSCEERNPIKLDEKGSEPELGMVYGENHDKEYFVMGFTANEKGGVEVMENNYESSEHADDLISHVPQKHGQVEGKDQASLIQTFRRRSLRSFDEAAAKTSESSELVEIQKRQEQAVDMSQLFPSDDPFVTSLEISGDGQLIEVRKSLSASAGTLDDVVYMPSIVPECLNHQEVGQDAN